MNILQKIFTDYYEQILYTLHPRQTEIENINKMIHCGAPSFGGAMYACPHCDHLKFIPFRCHNRFCPTCGNKYAMQRIDHYMTEEELTAEFGVKGWKQLPDAISRCYRFVPAKVEVEEHHIGVYASKTDEHMIKAPHPKNLLHGSLVSPSLAAAVINGKYVNAVPLYRLEKEFERYGLAITRQNMANWMIRLGESYLAVMYDYLHRLLYQYHVIQADETPVLVNKDGRPAGSKSWMWVYRSGFMYPEKQIILYEYQKTRNASHPREFLKDYSGICVTDGYQVYHTLEKEKEDLMLYK